MPHEANLILGAFTAFLITFLLIPKIIQFAEKRRLFDIPGERAAHTKIVPVFGGIGIFAGISFALIFWGIGLEAIEKLHFILSAIIIMFFVGIIDDLLSLSPSKKMMGQMIAILIVMYLADIRITSMHGVWGFFDLPIWVSWLFTIFTIIVIINAYNLIDGIDGLAAGVGIVAALLFGIVAYKNDHQEMAVLAFSLIGALLAYIRYNFHPARIFMGDTGSLVIGFILSILAIDLIETGVVTQEESFIHKGPLMAIAFIALPLFDSLRVFLIRVLKKRSPLYADRNHIHHALLDLGYSHKQTAIILYVASIFFIFIAWLLLEFNINISISILAVIAYLIMYIPFVFLKRREKDA